MKKKLLLLHLLAATFFAHAQNVGIGTANPVFKLDVKNGSINTDSVYRIGAITVLAMPGTGNLFVGEDAGRINTSFYNTFSGSLAGSSNTTGNSNSFFGQTSGLSNSTGDHNSFFGRTTGSFNTTGSSNSFYGRSAAYANTTGNYNTAIGNSSLTSITTGTWSTALGYNANVNTGAQTNATAIGAFARVDCDNCLVLGSVSGINGAPSGVNVGIGTTNPHTSAQLDVSSTAKGFLPPRMTTAQRNAIASPTPGLMLFNTTTQSLEIFTAYGWYGIQVQIPPRKLLGGISQEEAFSIQQTNDGGYIVAGNSLSSADGDVTPVNHGAIDYWIVKLDANRNITWNKLLGGNGVEFVSSIQQTSDGGYIVAGYSSSSANGDVTETTNGLTDYWIVKLDNTGGIVWNKLIGGGDNDIAKSIRQTTDGGYIVAGYSRSSATGDVTEINHGVYDYWIVKLDEAGNIIWNRLLGGNGNEEAYDILQGADATYVIAGQSTSSANGDVTGVNHGGASPIDNWIVRLSETGTILWNKLLGGTGKDEARSIQQKNGDDGYIVAGYSTSSANGDVTGTNHGAAFGSPDYWIVKLDRFGNITWNKLMGGNNFDLAQSIKPTTGGGYIVAGYSASSANGDVTASNHGVDTNDYWIVKLDDDGNIVWNQLIGGSVDDQAYSISQTVDGGFIVAGYSFSSFSGDVTSGNHGGKDIWIIRLGSNGYLY